MNSVYTYICKSVHILHYLDANVCVVSVDSVNIQWESTQVVVMVLPQCWLRSTHTIHEFVLWIRITTNQW